MEVAVISDNGKIRHRNEDYAEIFENAFKQQLLVLCDGIGGHQSGNVASQLTAELLGQKFLQQSEPFNVKNGQQWLRTAIQDTNASVYQKAQSAQQYHGMGTTLAVVLVLEQDFLIAHVGDSRVYGLTEDSVELLTEDHSLVNELLKRGQITQTEADNHPNKNIITRSIGYQEQVEVDERLVNKATVEHLLICSDGLTNMVAIEEIHAIVGNNLRADQAVKQLVKAANAAGGTDNITIILYTEGKEDN